METPPPATPPAGALPPDHVLQSGHTNQVDSVAFSPDGRWLASGSYDKTIRIWDLVTGLSVRTLSGHSDAVWCLSYSPDGRRLASASQDGTVRVWDPANGTSIYSVNLGSVAESVTLSSDGRFLVASGAPKGEEGSITIEIHNAATGEKLRAISLDWSRAYPLVVAPNGRLLSSGGGGEDGDVDVATKVWDVKTGEELKSFAISAQAISSDGRQIASIELKPERARIALHDAETGKAVRTIVAPDRYLGRLTLTPDGTRIAATRTSTSEIQFWETATGKPLETLPGDKTAPAPSIAFSADGKLLAVTAGSSINIWDVAGARKLRTLEGQPQNGSVAFEPDGRLLVSGPSILHEWDAGASQELRTIPVTMGNDLVFSADGHWVASNPQGKLKVWDAKSWAEGKVSPAESAFVWSIAFSRLKPPSALGESGIKWWQVGNDETASWIFGSTSSIALNPDQTLLAVAHARGGEFDVWDLKVGTKLATLAAHKLSVSGLAFSPDGNWLLTSGQEAPFTAPAVSAGPVHLESSVKLWDVSSWQTRETFPLDGLGVGMHAFSPDGRLLAIAGAPGLIELFDIAQDKKMRALTSRESWGGSLAFSPDGNWLAQDTPSGVKLWKLSATKK